MKYEEFTIGQKFHTKSFKITKENIMEFAQTFDPQYMHLDEEKAKEGRFQGIIASGIHTLNISFKLWVETGFYGEEIIAGRGMNHITFIKPVYPGDELHTIAEIINKRNIKQNTGLVTVLLSTYNDKDEKVFKGELTALMKI